MSVKAMHDCVGFIISRNYVLKCTQKNLKVKLSFLDHLKNATGSLS